MQRRVPGAASTGVGVSERMSERERDSAALPALGGQGLVVPPELLPSLRGVKSRPPETPRFASGSSVRAPGERAHFWFSRCGFTEITGLFLARGGWFSLRGAELSLERWSVKEQ